MNFRHHFLHHGCAFLFLTFLFGISLWIRSDAITTGQFTTAYVDKRRWGNETSMHFLDALIGMRQIPAAYHKYLPVNSVSRFEIDQGAPRVDFGPNWGDISAGHWAAFDTRGSGSYGALRRDRYGYETYLSFPAGSFFVVHWIFKVAGVWPNYSALQALDLAIQYICVILLFGFFIKLLTDGLKIESRKVSFISAVGASSYIFSVEPLFDHVMTFWAHHANQVIIISIMFVFIFTKPSNYRSLSLLILSLSGAYTEWTGYFINASIFIISLYRFVKSPHTRPALARDLVAIALGQVAATGIYLGLNGYNIGWDRFVSAMLRRFDVHRFGNGQGNIPELLDAVWYAYGPYLVMTILAFVIVRFIILRRPILDAYVSREPIFYSHIILLSALSENLVLAHHAVDLGFDHLKGVYWVALVMIVSIGAVIKSKARSAIILMSSLSLVAAVTSVAQFADLYGNHRDVLSGKNLYNLLCFRGMHDIGRTIATSSDPKSDLIFINVVFFPQNIAPDVGDKPIIAATLSEVRSVLTQSRREVARYFVLSGHDFDFKGDRQYMGRISAEIILRKGMEGAQIKFFPAQADTPIASMTGKANFHTDLVMPFISIGMTLIDEDGRHYEVTTKSQRSIGYRPIDGRPLPQDPPQWLEAGLAEKMTPWNRDILVTRKNFDAWPCYHFRLRSLFGGLHLYGIGS